MFWVPIGAIWTTRLTIALASTQRLSILPFVPKTPTVSIYIPNLTPFWLISKTNEIRVLNPPENSYMRHTRNREPLGTSLLWRQAAIPSTRVAESSTSQKSGQRLPIIKSDFMVFQSRGAPARTHVVRAMIWIRIWNPKTIPNMMFILKGTFYNFWKQP